MLWHQKPGRGRSEHGRIIYEPPDNPPSGLRHMSMRLPAGMIEVELGECFEVEMAIRRKTNES